MTTHRERPRYCTAVNCAASTSLRVHHSLVAVRRWVDQAGTSAGACG
ncbi:hypothetical protein [Kribbella sp. NBC_00359]